MLSVLQTTENKFYLIFYLTKFQWRGRRSSIEAGWRIYASVNYAIIGSDICLTPVRRQAIIWTNVYILLIGNKYQWNSDQEAMVFNQENAIENVVCWCACYLWLYAEAY